MSQATIEEIKAAINGLPEEQRATLASWLNVRTMDAWDRQMEQDFAPGGRGAAVLEQFRKEAAGPDVRALEEGLAKRRLPD